MITQDTAAMDGDIDMYHTLYMIHVFYIISSKTKGKMQNVEVFIIV